MSRLSRNAEKKTKKQLYFSLLGIVVIGYILFKFGIPALVNLSLFLSGLHSTSTNTSTSSKTIVQPPILSIPFTATNSATITVGGSAVSNETIQLYVNDDMVATTKTKDDGSFTFDNVTLTQQQNTIKAKAEKDKSTSDFSDQLTVSYLQKAPSLSIDSPPDGQSFDKDHRTVLVKGKTDPDVRVTVNGFWAITDSSGNYSYNLTLQGGDNTITVVATDTAGNNTQKQIKVTLNQ